MRGFVSGEFYDWGGMAECGGESAYIVLVVGHGCGGTIRGVGWCLGGGGGASWLVSRSVQQCGCAGGGGRWVLGVLQWYGIAKKKQSLV